jgi:tetratricopeptide (TPR) repeat protein
MSKSTIWLSLIAIVVSFVAGFMLANTINRSEVGALKAENDRLKNESGKPKPGDDDATLSDEEIRAKIAEADRSPTNLAFQRELGAALYRYAAMKQDVPNLEASSRLLLRAHQLDPKDHDIVVGLAHSYFDTGYYGKQNAAFDKAREYYGKALALRPRDVEIQTEIAMTYFLLDPPENEKAIAEFQKSLAIDPKHEKTLQFLAEAYAKINKVDEAEKTLGRLREVNPRSPEIPVITSLIAQAGQTK